ncbi:myoD family inhibitor domain-containing protein-like isoform X1 [Stegostoma tigrinum]|uniref:myoD family inhibitor domain-containing protein-like isoform X1 n=1 Tax=Stegostoma tigrinum TaxID=3053191 RepID=UPI00286FEC66|nr:myoD family inhibitor domain-containing protein-like isoform X1 [Stegostoma tigrinum]
MAQSEKVHVDSPGIQTQPEPGRASSRRDNRCGGGHSSDSQRSLIGDEFSANESSQLIPSSGEPTVETLQDPSLARPGPASGDTAEKRGSATASGIQPRAGLPPVCTSPSTCSDKTRLGSTSSVYTRTSYKSASTQLPPPAGEDVCASMLLSCLFCQFTDCFQWVPWLCSDDLGGFGCPLCQGAVEREQICHCCCGSETCIFEACQQTNECLELALEISELCYH